MKNLYRLTAVILYLLTPLAAASVPGPGGHGDAVALDDVRSGSLLVPAGGDTIGYVPLPMMKTAVDISVTGVAAHVEVSQTFGNPSTRWLEAVYVFPLPADSAVTHLRMAVADRIIEGVVEETRKARQRYTHARQQGNKAALVEQQRPNLFTSSVANIPPGESITVTLSYLQTVSRVDDAYSLRVPLVAGPRYVPPGAVHAMGLARDGTSTSAGPALQNPNTIPPAFGRVNPVTIRFDLDAGFELDTVTSSYHDVDISRSGNSRASGHLAAKYFADRDFDLRWRSVTGAAPRAAAFIDRQGDHAWLLLMLQPPLPHTAMPSPPRDLILIIDASGSMYGDSIEQARASARFALSTLGPSDRFNLIRFSDAATMLFPSPQPADPAALAQAERFLSATRAEGGTNMAAALRRAFDNPSAPDALRQLVFLTDGAVGNETAMFSMIAAGTRTARLFAVGIGSAPNGYFMRRAARAGRGTYTFIGRRGEVESRMAALFDRIRKPALTDIRIDWRGAVAQPGDARIPDLYYGNPLTLTSRVKGFRGLTVSGRYAGQSWSQEVEADAATQAEWVSTLWARNRIKQLRDDLLGGGDREQVKESITRIGLEHQLVTPYTSLVAVERRISRRPSDSLYHADAPVNLPKGWSYRHVFGSLPQTALGWRARLAEGLALLALGLAILWLIGARPSLRPRH
jgi:Ca-activated chloride channel family protein